ncbi:MAG: patatin-like phospholipase family protein [Bacteroidota bacterium]
MKTIKYCLLSFFFLTISTSVFAQKVGLVLSGGGAKGVTHIGVIKALEESGIPIDYIAGTSMGAIIGGLYAAGYSPDEMEKIFLGDEFASWISGIIDKKYIYYFKKEAPNASWIDLRFNYNIKIKPKLPTNIIAPYQMDFAFLEIFGSANAIAKNNFDNLFVPFRCVAADIYTSKQVVLKKGDLGRAIRASMTFPFYFKPIKIDSTLLFDGGMYNNFPTNVMYDDFFPDIIIGSKAVGNYPKPDEDDIISQLQNMLMEKTDYSVICGNGILISPNIKSVSLTDFENTAAFIDSGYVAAMRKIKNIRQYVTDSVSSKQLNEKRKIFNEKKPELLIDSILIDGLTVKQKIYINRLLFHKSMNIPIKEIKSEYFKLLADSKIEHISPKLLFIDSTKKFNLYLDIKKDKNFVAEFGGNISSSPINEAFVQVQLKIFNKTAKSFILNTYMGRFYSSAMAKIRFDYASTIPLYFETAFLIHQWDFFKTKTYFFEDKTPSYLIQNEKYITFAFGLPAGNKARYEVRFTEALTSSDYYQNNTFGRNDTADQTNFNFNSIGIMYEYNTLNKKQFANSGSLFQIKAKYVDGKEEYIPGSTSINKNLFEIKQHWFQTKITFDTYFNKIGFNTPGLLIEGFYSNQKLFNNYTASVLSSAAFTPFPESHTLFLSPFRSNIYAAIGAKNIINLAKNIDLRLEVYLFQPYEEIVQNNNLTASFSKKFEKRYYMASSSLVFHSPIGPASLSFNYYQNTDQPFSLVFNLGYILFNPKARD